MVRINLVRVLIKSSIFISITTERRIWMGAQIHYHKNNKKHNINYRLTLKFPPRRLNKESSGKTLTDFPGKSLLGET